MIRKKKIKQKSFVKSAEEIVKKVNTSSHRITVAVAASSNQNNIQNLKMTATLNTFKGNQEMVFKLAK